MAIDRVAWALLEGSVTGWIVKALFFSPGLPAPAEAVPVTGFIKNHSSPRGAEISCRVQRRETPLGAD